MTLHRIALAFSLAYGAAAVWEDWQRQRISNRRVLGGLAFAAVGYALLAVSAGAPAPGFYAALARHLALSLAAAVGLWYAGVWPAGDAKLFTAFSALASLVEPSLRGFPDSLFLAMLVNVFVAAALFVVVLVLVEWGAWVAAAGRIGVVRELQAALRKAARRLVEAWAHRWNWAVLVWNLFVLFLAFQTLLGDVRGLGLGALPQLAVYLTLLLGWPRVSQVFVRRRTAAWSLFAVSAVLAPVLLALRADLVAKLAATLRMTAGFAVFMTVGRLALLAYLERTRRMSVVSSELRGGMVLVPESQMRVAQVVPRAYPDGLSEDEARAVRERFASNPRTLSVYRSRSFAVWIFAGYLWTVFSRRNVIEAVVSLAR